MCKPLLIKQETEYQLNGLFFFMSLFLVFWSNCHEMVSIDKERSLVRGVQYKTKSVGREWGWTTGVYVSGGVYEIMN